MATAAPPATGERALRTSHLQGVYNTDIDTRQQKVIVNGDVDAQTLIKKLTKSGKHAELWPEPADNKKKSSKSKKKDKQIDPETSTNEDTEKKPQEKSESSEQNPPKPTEGGGATGGTAAKSGEDVKFCDGAAKTGGGGGVKISDGAAKSSGGGGGVKFCDGVAKDGGVAKSGGGGEAVGSAGNQTSAAEKMDVASDHGADKNGGGGSNSGSDGKKKKKKGQQNPTEGEPSPVGAAASKSPNDMGPPSVNMSPPRQHGHQYPPHYYVPPPPVYAASDNTSYPASRYTTSYYASPAPGAYALHSLPLNDEARSGRRDLNPQPQPWQGYALPLSYFRQLRDGTSLSFGGKREGRSSSGTSRTSYWGSTIGICECLDALVHIPAQLREKLSPRQPLLSFLDMLSPEAPGENGDGDVLRPSPVHQLEPHSSAVDVTDQPHSSGQQLCSASSADCQPVQLTSEDSSHPAQHLSSRRRLQSVSQGQTTPEDPQ
ncbi:hypothetical protein Acr_07g0007720 [Actinidia rufa]|uniref:Heavy metal transport/detoxification superfamily protein n=1 Tax=Actinidia rufa TaxID=165716 RepID=A0A7J0EVU5_9ERIC|nr:hypothetical protein Acr_07g0007720 [Actinidia rufa]